jgi:hypothetical protein
MRSGAADCNSRCCAALLIHRQRVLSLRRSQGSAHLVSIVRHMGAQNPNADQAAGPPALRLDELPAEVRAGELAPCLLPQGSSALRAGTAPRLQCLVPGLCRSCRRARSNLPGTPFGRQEPCHRRFSCREFAGAHRTLTSKASSQQQLCLRPDARGRRFKVALGQPFWSTLEGDIVRRLWRALGWPGAPLALLL